MSLITTGGNLKAAFRCKSCGTLHHSGHAGERIVPLKCRVCGAGVVPGLSVAALQKAQPALFEGWTQQDFKWISEGGRVGKLPFEMVFVADHANWQILGDMKPDELKALGIDAEVEKHVPTPKGQATRDPAVHAINISDGAVSKDAVATLK